MRAGMPCLAGLLRGQQTACATESEWRDVLAIGQEENLLPWLAACLSTLQNQLPSSVSLEVVEICRQARHQAFLWSATLKHLLAAFHQRGIAVISLKGPWLAERLYGDVSLRCYCDLDFLVRPDDWNATEYVLSELGFSPLGPADDRHRRWQRAGIYIEPHFQLANPLAFDLDTEGVWSRARFSAFHGVPGWLLAPADELLFLCIHAVRHCFERLSILLDLNLAFRQLPQPDMSNYGRRSSGLKNALALSWMLATRLDNLPPLSAPWDAWLASRPNLEKIAKREWQRSMLRPASSINWIAVDLFYVRMNAHGWSRFPDQVRCARILLDHLTGRYGLASLDFDFAARFHLYRNWQVRMLRPVRLLIKMARLSRFTLKRCRQSSLLPDSAG